MVWVTQIPCSQVRSNVPHARYRQTSAQWNRCYWLKPWILSYATSNHGIRHLLPSGLLACQGDAAKEHDIGWVCSISPFARWTEETCRLSRIELHLRNTTGSRLKHGTCWSLGSAARKLTVVESVLSSIWRIFICDEYRRYWKSRDLPGIVDPCFQSCKEAQVCSSYFMVPVRCPLSISCWFKESSEIPYSCEPRWQRRQTLGSRLVCRIGQPLDKGRCLTLSSFPPRLHIL